VLVFEDQYADYGLSETGTLFLLLTLVWSIAANGLNQQPGFADVMGDKPDNVSEIAQPKYQRSALQTSDLERIASKLKAHVFDEKLYLEANLNLFKLAKMTGVSTQNISQTLSQFLETTFFDFVNQARIEEAKNLLKENKKTVLEVSELVGFNARSSFYKAFKKETGMTPSEFKKQGKSK
jgi:AraC-like DNA-binding protein